jgi:hypothetical protein
MVSGLNLKAVTEFNNRDQFYFDSIQIEKYVETFEKIISFDTEKRIRADS